MYFYCWEQIIPDITSRSCSLAKLCLVAVPTQLYCWASAFVISFAMIAPTTAVTLVPPNSEKYEVWNANKLPGYFRVIHIAYENISAVDQKAGWFRVKCSNQMHDTRFGRLFKTQLCRSVLYELYRPSSARVKILRTFLHLTVGFQGRAIEWWQAIFTTADTGLPWQPHLYVCIMYVCMYVFILQHENKLNNKISCQKDS